jgi:hypothetical protein
MLARFQLASSAGAGAVVVPACVRCSQNRCTRFFQRRFRRRWLRVTESEREHAGDERDGADGAKYVDRCHAGFASAAAASTSSSIVRASVGPLRSFRRAATSSLRSAIARFASRTPRRSVSAAPSRGSRARARNSSGVSLRSQLVRCISTAICPSDGSMRLWSDRSPSQPPPREAGAVALRAWASFGPRLCVLAKTPKHHTQLTLVTNRG